MKPSLRPDRRLRRTLLYAAGALAALAAPGAAYIIPEDGDIAPFLDSVVAEEEFIDTLPDAPGGMYRLDFNDVSFNYRQHATDIIRLLPGTYTNYFNTYGNRELVRLAGTRPAQTALLVNGMPVEAGDQLGMDLHLIPLQNIMRIEAVPAGAALTYGTYAPGGAVNIVTRGFHHQLPFYQFTTLTQEEGLEYAGHLHFAQRIYRNLNFYMSSLLKKNTLEGDDYTAIQYNLKLDAYLKNGWEGSFYSYSHTDDRQSVTTTPVTDQSGTDENIENGAQRQQTEFNLTQILLSGTPYRDNRTRLRYYKNYVTRNFANKDYFITWNSLGLMLSQDLHGLVPGHAFSGDLDFHHKTYGVQSRDEDFYLTTTADNDSLTAADDLSDFTMSLRARDRATISDRLSFDAALALNLYGYGSGPKLLPTASLEYRLNDAHRIYATAERTFANPTPMEQSELPSPHTRYRMQPLNGSLKPEHGYGVSTGWRFSMNDAFSASAGIFGRAVHDAIYWDWPARQLTDSVYLANRTGTETRSGILADIRFNLWKGKVNGGASLSQLFDTGPANYGRIPSLPATKLGYFLRARQTLRASQLMFAGITLNGEYVGEQRKRIWDGDGAPFPAQSFLDVTLFYNILYIKTYFTVRNVFNRVNQDLGETLDFDDAARKFFGYPRPPMDYRFGVSLELGGVYDREEESEEFDNSSIDSDGDGIYDSDDECPEAAEDRDGFRDEDGCPDGDNDRDGVPDDKDKCPGTPLSARVNIDGCVIEEQKAAPTGPPRPAVRRTAVADFTGGGVRPEELPGLSGVVRSVLNGSDAYDLLSADAMFTQLGTDKRSALADCNTTACALNAASGLDVPYLVFGTISKTGRTYTFTLHLLDTAAKTELLSVTEKYMGPAEGLSAAAESIAKKLLKTDR